VAAAGAAAQGRPASDVRLLMLDPRVRGQTSG
jgi:hypothetical protein